MLRTEGERGRDGSGSPQAAALMRQAEAGLT